MSGQPNPFRGLQAYNAGEPLFGRDQDLVLMRDRLSSARTTLLFASAGVGKTSFLQAKLIPNSRERGYAVAYCSKWSRSDWHADLCASVARDLEVAPEPTLCDILASRADNAATPVLLVLDQFEEAFQYNAHQPAFADFLDELCRVINDPSLPLRVVLALREEFLGELSLFDNRIPDVFGNYYRLRCPTTLDVQDIVEETAALAGNRVDPEGLRLLIDDLRRVESLDRGGGANDSAALRRDVLPPFLQIACQRLWSGDGTFLADYRAGSAQRALRDFLHEQLTALTSRQRALVADAFDYLVTKRGAKMAYELERLAQHMQVPSTELGQALDALSAPDRCVLRTSAAPDGSRWFELYHDVYGPFVDAWSREQQQKQRRRRQRRLRVGLAVLLGLVLGGGMVYRFVVTPLAAEALIRQPLFEAPPLDAGRGSQHDAGDIREANYRGPHFVECVSAFSTLAGTPGWGKRARAAWADWWERRADLAERREVREEALLSLATSVALDSSETRRARLRALLGDDSKSLLMTYRGDDDRLASRPQPRAPRFPQARRSAWSADEHSVLFYDGDLLRVWDATHAGAPSEIGPFDTTQWACATDGRPRPQLPSEPADRRVFHPRDIAKHSDMGTIFVGDLTRRDGRAISVLASEAGRLIGCLGPDAPTPPLDVRLSANGNRVAILRSNIGLQVWQVESAAIKELNLPRAAAVDVRAMDWSADGARLLTWSHGGTIALWDLAAAARYAALGSALGRDPQRVRLSADNNGYALLADATSIDVWSLSEGRSVRELSWSDPRRVESLGVSDGWVVSVTSSGVTHSSSPGSMSLSGWNLATGQSVERPMGARPMALNRTGQKALIVGRLMQKRSVLKMLQQADTPGASAVAAREAALAVDGQTLFTVDQQQTLRRRQLEPHGSLPGSETALQQVERLSADGRVGFVRVGAGRDVIDTQTGRRLLRLQPGQLRSPSAMLSPDGRYVAVWDSPSLRLARVDGLPPHGSATLDLSYAASDPRATFSPDGRYFAAVASDLKSEAREGDRLRVWDLTAEAPRRTGLPALATDIFAFVADRLVAADGAKVVIWPPSGGRAVAELANGVLVTLIKASADGQRLFTLTADRQAHVWDLGSQRRLGSVAFAGDVQDVAFVSGRDEVAVLTTGWLHVLALGNEGVGYRFSRWLDGGLGQSLRVVDGAVLRILLYTVGNQFQVDDIALNGGTSAPDAASESELPLLDEIQRRLGLSFDSVGDLRPRRVSGRDSDALRGDTAMIALPVGDARR